MAGDNGDETMNKLLKSGTLACILMACMAGGQSAATSATSAHDAPKSINALLTSYDTISFRPATRTMRPTKIIKRGEFSLIVADDVRLVLESTSQNR